MPDPSRSADQGGDPSTGPRVLLAIVCLILASLPFLVVTIPPVTDLAQHLAQTRLLLETLQDPGGPYRIQWYTPYWLVYAVMSGWWSILPPLAAGRATLLTLLGLWLAAIHVLAARRRRHPDAAVLAGVLIFNLSFYFGFLSFLVGFPIFVVWLLRTSTPRRRFDGSQAQSAHAGWSVRDGLILLVLAFLLYTAHALWFAFALLWLVAHDVLFRVPRRILLLRLLSVSPAMVAAILWYPQLAAQGFASETAWLVSPLERLSWDWFTHAAGSGLRGATSATVCAVLLIWVVLTVWQHRTDLATQVDRTLLLAAALLGGAALTLPYRFNNTIAFAERWLPPALIFLLLSLPAPRGSAGLRRIASVGVFAALCLATAFGWTTFERNELSGLPQALAALPDHPRVIGLDFLGASRVITGRPFIQMFAYAQVLHGGELNFSFAEFAPMPVIYRNPRVLNWQPGLEWMAQNVDARDFAAFDFALIGAFPDRHAKLLQGFPLAPLTQDGVWRLYRIQKSEKSEDKGRPGQ